MECGGGLVCGSGMVVLVGKGSSGISAGLVGGALEVLSWSLLPVVASCSEVEEWEGLEGCCLGGGAFCRAFEALVVFLLFVLLVDLWRT